MIKSKDLYLVLVVVIIAVVVAILLAGTIFKTEKVRTKVEVVEPISSDFQLPDDTYFNDNSLNLTQIIKIGDGNPNPFNDPTP
jgi:hypothetical protein